MEEVYEWMTYNGREHVRWESGNIQCLLDQLAKPFLLLAGKLDGNMGPAELMKGPRVIRKHSVYTCTTPVQEDKNLEKAGDILKAPKKD